MSSESSPPNRTLERILRRREGVVLSEQGEAVDLVLGDQWTLWLDNGGLRRTKEEYEKGTVEVRTVKTAREFWKCWNQLSPLMGPLRSSDGKDTEATEKCNICVFRKGIRPSWEDPANVAGGSWTLKVPRSVSDSVATTVVCEVIGGQVPIKAIVPGEEPICGVFIRVRPNVIAVDVWNRFIEPQDAVQAVKDHFNRVIAEIKLPTPVLLPPVVFTPHNSPSKRCSSHMSSHISLSTSSSDLRSYTKSGARIPSSDSSSPSAPSSPLTPDPTSPLHSTSGLLASPSKRRTSSRRSPSTHTRNGLSSSMGLSSEDLLVSGDPVAGSTLRLPSRNASNTLMSNDLNDHFRSASVGVQNPASQSYKPSSRLAPVVAQPSNVSFQNHMRKSSGLQQALPLLLRQGYAVPFAAYKDLVQEQTFSETVPGSAEAQKCEEHLRKSSLSSARYSPTIAALPPDVIGHRRAFSLDRTTLDAAYSRYAQAKQAAYLRDKELERQEQLQKQPASAQFFQQDWNKNNTSQEPIPGLGMGGDGTGLFSSFSNVDIPKSALAASSVLGESDSSSLCAIPGTGANASGASSNSGNDDSWMKLLPQAPDVVASEDHEVSSDVDQTTTESDKENDEEPESEDDTEEATEEPESDDATEEATQKPTTEEPEPAVAPAPAPVPAAPAPEEQKKKEDDKKREAENTPLENTALDKHPIVALLAVAILQFVLIPLVVVFTQQE